MANAFLRSTTDQLARVPREAIETWPEVLSGALMPSIDVPAEISHYHFDVLKHTFEDGEIMVVVRRFRRLWFGEEVTADGFYLEPDGAITRFTQSDIYSVT
jgi:hypothetical protein